MGKTVLRFCYRIEAGAGLGINLETGEPCAIYTQATLPNDRQLTAEEYATVQRDTVRVIVDALGIDPKHVTPITEAEYDAEMAEDEEAEQ